ncbi:MAG: PadR family transcriptional regulator [Erysipelotrichaceae bacterium]
MNAQFKKGALELCVLAQLADGDMYGYELTERISAQMQVATGTLYLLLKRLKDDDYVTTYLQEGSEGPARKYYKLSSTGRNYYEELAAEWKEFVTQVGNLLKGRDNA